MTQAVPQSAEYPSVKTFEVTTPNGKHTIRALSPSVDEGGYLSFYRPGATKAYDPVAGFPSSQWTSWKLIDD